ncbi:MAG: glycosyltransferase family 39 protein [Thermodesulfovibrionales bacterium]|nr:glycosyltransferase family 39 protein [Thermodesulfovibrionales bacterium]
MSLHEIDTSLFSYINRGLQNSIFDVAMPVITDKYYFLILILMAWLLIKDKKRALIPIALTVISVALSDWTSNILKHVIERLRPCNALETVNLLVGCSDSFSMPSNHAANAFAVIFALSYQSIGDPTSRKKWLRWLLLSIALVVGFSRVYVGVHYPADVIVGAFTGIIISILVINLYKWAYLRYKFQPYNTVFLMSLLFFILFRLFYITSGVVDLSPDEAHYWEWSRRLDLSYYSKGPMIAYLIAVGTAIFGDNIFGIRIMAVIFSALSSIALYLLGKRLFDERTGAAAAILMQIVPLYSAYGILFTIDSPFIFFWILSLLLFWEAVRAEDRIQNPEFIGQQSIPPQPPLNKEGIKGGVWIVLGISIGLGLLTKYTMAFFYVCAFLFLFTSKQHKNILRTKWPYISLLASLIVFSPVIIWNFSNDWVTVRHTAGQAHVAEGFNISIISFAEFVGSQLGVITPIILILMAYSLFKLRKEHAGHFLFWFSVPFFLFFFLKSIQAKVQANWALPGYAAGFIAFASLFVAKWETLRKGVRIAVIAGITLALFTTAAAYCLPVLKLPSGLDPSSRIRGWKELGTEISRLSDELSAEGPLFIFSDRYQVSSELAFYVKGRPVTYCANMDRRMNQYDLWPGFNNLIHFNAIFVTINDVQIPEEFATAFNRCDKNRFDVSIGGRNLRSYSIITCYDFKGMQQKGMSSY